MPSGVGDSLEYAAFQLGRAAYSFLGVLQANYLLAKRPSESSPDEVPPFPHEIIRASQRAAVLEKEMIGRRPSDEVLGQRAAQLESATEGLINGLREAWYSDCHLELIEAVLHADHPASHWRVQETAQWLTSCGLPRNHWINYRQAIEQLRDSLPEGASLFFRLGWSLAVVKHPNSLGSAELSVEHDGESDGWCPLHVIEEIRIILHSLRVRFPALSGLPARLDGPEFLSAAATAYLIIERELRAWTGSGPGSDGQIEPGDSQVDQIESAASPTGSNPGNESRRANRTAAPLALEDRQRLIRLKDRLVVRFTNNFVLALAFGSGASCC